MAEDFLSQFLGNPQRARVVRAFIFNQAEVFSTAQAAKRAGLNQALVLREIKSLEKLGILKRAKLSIKIAGGKRVVAGKQKEPAWIFGTGSKYASALSKFVHEVSPVRHNKIVGALKRTGRLSVVVLSGNFMGDPTRPTDIILAADSLNEVRLEQAIKGLEPELGREIRYAVFSTPEFCYRLTIQDRLIRDTLDYPHIVLLDRTRLL